MDPRLFVKSLGIAFLSCALITTSAAAFQERTYNFVSKRHGFNPWGGLIFDTAGNLYGTTISGGTGKLDNVCPEGCGVAFELSASPKGAKETVLHNFCSAPNCADGAVPYAGLILDSAGNLYGTAANGGLTDHCSQGCGVAFELTRNPDGTWLESILHSFTGLEDGSIPVGALVSDSAGNLYGTTAYGGTYGAGIVFELTPITGGWNEKVLYSFTGGADGSNPSAGLVFDSAGNLYGSASGINSNGAGVVFELKPAFEVWAETVLYSFTGGSDGQQPESDLVFDTVGNLYGSTYTGGMHDQRCPYEVGCGVIFELTPDAGGWGQIVIHAFTGGNDGAYPSGKLTFDSGGNILGTTIYGGKFGDGVAFRLAPDQDGSWQEESFSFSANTGSHPQGGLILDTRGNVYGTASQGGFGGNGTVIVITP